MLRIFDQPFQTLCQKHHQYLQKPLEYQNIFRGIKQKLRTKGFVANPEGAVLIQLYAALTVYLLLAWQKILSKSGLSVQHLFQRTNLKFFGTYSVEELLNQQRRKTEMITTSAS